MRDLYEKIERPYTVSVDTELFGMITADTTVLSGATFVVRGMITADLIVKPGAKAFVHGMVNGCIRNAGYVELHGQADTLEESAGATTKLVGSGYFKGSF
jgi:cytoskeletal protein CcmA (bactofilin family)